MSKRPERMATMAPIRAVHVSEPLEHVGYHGPKARDFPVHIGDEMTPAQAQAFEVTCRKLQREAEVDAAVRAGLSRFDPHSLLVWPETDKRFALAPDPIVIDAILWAWREQHDQTP